MARVLEIADADLATIARAIKDRGKLVVYPHVGDTMEASIQAGERRLFSGVSRTSPSAAEQLSGALEYLARALREQEERDDVELNSYRQAKTQGDA